MTDTVEVMEARFYFGDSVWDALKADANDLRKQQRIVRAFDEATRQLEADKAELKERLANLSDAIAGAGCEPCEQSMNPCESELFQARTALAKHKGEG